MDALYLPAPLPPSSSARAPTPHCGAVSGVWPIGVYDPATLDDVDVPETKAARYDWSQATEGSPARRRREEARVLLHAAVLETLIVFDALSMLRFKAFRRRSNAALSATFDIPSTLSPTGPLRRAGRAMRTPSSWRVRAAAGPRARLSSSAPSATGTVLGLACTGCSRVLFA